jgi:hypothetical protein
MTYDDGSVGASIDNIRFMPSTHDNRYSSQKKPIRRHYDTIYIQCIIVINKNDQSDGMDGKVVPVSTPLLEWTASCYYSLNC